MYELKKRLDVAFEQFEAFKNTIDIEAKELRLKELEAQSTDPDLWKDQDSARKIMQEIGDIRNELAEIITLSDELSILKELVSVDDNPDSLFEEIAKIEAKIHTMTLKLYLSGPYDAHNAIIGIHAGQGGTEAMDWTSMLIRMYMRFCERRGWRFEAIDETRGEEAGIKSATFKIVGKYAYGYLKHESGAHRLVRQSPFNADNLRQTSFSLVEVMPEIDDVDIPDIVIKPEDLDIQFYRAGGHGGQNVNKVSTAVRLTHIPSGIVVTAQTERFQEQNRKIALGLLRAKLWLRNQEEVKQEKQAIKGQYRPASWGTQIRSYVLHPYKMVKDLRTDIETSDTTGVLDGDLDSFIEAELQLK
jgi:peptide chain release factor 2